MAFGGHTLATGAFTKPWNRLSFDSNATIELLHHVFPCHNYRNNYFRVNLHFKEQVLNKILGGKIENQRAIKKKKKTKATKYHCGQLTYSTFLTIAESSKVIGIEWIKAAVFTSIILVIKNVFMAQFSSVVQFFLLSYEKKTWPQ